MDRIVKRDAQTPARTMHVNDRMAIVWKVANILDTLECSVSPALLEDMDELVSCFAHRIATTVNATEVLGDVLVVVYRPL